jgi:hypothetical protein
MPKNMASTKLGTLLSSQTTRHHDYRRQANQPATSPQQQDSILPDPDREFKIRFPFFFPGALQDIPVE